MENGEQWSWLGCRKAWLGIDKDNGRAKLTETALLANLGLVEARLLVMVYLVAPRARQSHNFLRSKELALHRLQRAIAP